jgi:hypothetical protein
MKKLDEERCEIRNCEYYSFLLAGYSLSYDYVDENKTNQNKYHNNYFVHTCCIRIVI